jgi:hypothetical protein
MAVLDNDDFTAYKRALRNNPTARAEMKAAGISKAQWKAALQSIEDWYEADRATVSGLIDTATSPAVLTNALKKKLGRVWMQRKFGGE